MKFSVTLPGAYKTRLFSGRNQHQQKRSALAGIRRRLHPHTDAKSALTCYSKTIKDLSNLRRVLDQRISENSRMVQSLFRAQNYGSGVVQGVRFSKASLLLLSSNFVCETCERKLFERRKKCHWTLLHNILDWVIVWLFAGGAKKERIVNLLSSHENWNYY